MSAWEDISDTYSSAASKAFPLQRLAVFALAFFVSFAAQHQTHKSMLETLAVLPISEFFTFDSGPLAEATAGNFLWAALAVIACVVLSRWIIKIIYTVIDKATSASTNTKSLNLNWVLSLSFEERKQAADLYEQGLAEVRNRIKMLTGVNELAIGVALVFAVGAYFGNMIDGAVALAAFAIAVKSHKSSIDAFLNDYYGGALIKAALQGQPLPDIGKIG